MRIPRQIVAYHAVVVVVLGLHVVVGAAMMPQSGRLDPERVLVDRFQFSPDELAQVRAGTAVAKMIAGAVRDELAIGGAIRLDGDKNRLAEWIRNIAHFRGSAELGLARVVSSPPAVASFADLTLDATDLAALQKCTSKSCDLHLSTDAVNDFRTKVQWGTPTAPEQASSLAREMLVGYATAYLAGGDAALGNGFGDLLQRATNLNQLLPALARYLQRFPAETLTSVEQRLYWSTMPAGKASIVSLHHLVIYRDTAGDIQIADKTIYASRYFDVGALVISLQDAVDGRGYFLIAGSRMKSSDLTGVAGTVLRRRIQQSAVETVQMYLGWMRDSLAQPPEK
ncbi:MAG TPA: hypothetical protein VH439_07110 [Gemmatimonadales bacterium]|jgi:hypothetical protein